MYQGTKACSSGLRQGISGLSPCINGLRPCISTHNPYIGSRPNTYPGSRGRWPSVWVGADPTLTSLVDRERKRVFQLSLDLQATHRRAAISKPPHAWAVDPSHVFLCDPRKLRWMCGWYCYRSHWRCRGLLWCIVILSNVYRAWYARDLWESVMFH